MAYEQHPADAATYVVVLTHDARFDEPALGPALRSDAAYIGALGSRRAQDARRRRLLNAGYTEDDIARIRGPLGLDIGAVTPAETAVSILAEVLAVRADRQGGPLSQKAGRIHPEAVAN
jgi:xanthine dehydrogenase accessory factor